MSKPSWLMGLAIVSRSFDPAYGRSPLGRGRGSCLVFCASEIEDLHTLYSSIAFAIAADELDRRPADVIDGPGVSLLLGRSFGHSKKHRSAKRAGCGIKRRAVKRRRA
jgi:hypothetical protein